MAFQHRIKPVADGEPVEAGVANRVPLTNARNINYLKDLIDAASLGETVFARNVSVESAASVSMPVYYNSAESRFERALAGVSVDDVTGVAETDASAHFFGVVYSKHSSTLADVLLFGWAKLDLTLSAGAGATDGVYYLSASTPGELARRRPPVGVPVLRKAGDKVFVVPQLTDFVDRHVHYKFTLACRPAGAHTPPSPDGTHTIVDPDDTLEGWLPADHASFAGKAPASAKFGYNLLAHESLRNAFPPLPTSSASVEWNKGLDADSGAFSVPLGEQGLVIIDRNGIWWTSDCYGDVPWPVDFETGDSLSESLPVGECTRDLYMEMTLWFLKISFASDSGVVTSLRSIDDRLVVRCADGEDGTAGDLLIDLDLELGVSDTLINGSTVFKELDDQTFKQGRVVEGVYSGSNNVTISGEYSRKLVIGNPASANVYQGLVSVEVQASPTRVLGVSEVRLEGVGQEFYANVMYLGFEAEEDARYRARVDVPADLELDAPRMTLRLRLMGSEAGALPQLVVTARRIPRPSGVLTPEDLPLEAEEFSVTIPTTATLSSAYQYVEAVSDPFDVEPGDLVFLYIGRTDADAYAGQVGVLHHEVVLESSS